MPNVLDELYNETLEEESVEILKDKGKQKEASWKEKCRYDLELFCKHYFPDVFLSDFCEFHRDVFKSLEKYILDPEYKTRRNHMVRAAPRGTGKSQVISMGFPLWCAVYGYRRNILIVSDTNAQAEQFIADIRIELEDNEDLIADFGNFVGDRVWNSGRIVTSTGVHIVGKGANQKLRGIKYNNTRPDVVIIDDLENDESVATPDQRQKLFSWFMKALMKCGSPITTFVYIGTILSYDSLLNKVLSEPQFSMWNRKVYKAIYKFSSDPKWDIWEKMILESTADTDDSSIERRAYEFYKESKEEMLSDVECLWPQKSDDYYYDLMLEKVMDEDSFNSEQQNTPQTESTRIFKDEWIQRNTYEVLPPLKQIFGAVDPTIVDSKQSDTSAIVILGKGEDNLIYVLEADVKKRRAEDVIDDMYRIISVYYDRLDGFVVETNAMQQFFANTVKQKFLECGLYVKWMEVKHPQGNPKDRRIKSMIPYIRNDMIKFREDQKKLISQLRNYPKAGHDDGPDCLQMALEAILGISQESSQQFAFGSLTTTREHQGFSLFNRRR